MELDQPDALDRFAFDMLDAGDVEEVVLIIVDDEAFHLRRVHPAVRLGHIQHGHPQIWEDVPRHAIDCQKPHQCNGYDHRQKRDRASQCKRYQVHRAASARSAAPGPPSAPRRHQWKLRAGTMSLSLLAKSEAPQKSTMTGGALEPIRTSMS